MVALYLVTGLSSGKLENKILIVKPEVQIKYVYPTINPTIMQQSKEMQARYEEMKKQNEQSFKEFCEKMPSASICKK